MAEWCVLRLCEAGRDLDPGGLQGRRRRGQSTVVGRSGPDLRGRCGSGGHGGAADGAMELARGRARPLAGVGGSRHDRDLHDHAHGVVHGAGVELGGPATASSGGCGLRAADCDCSVARASGGGRGRPHVRPTAVPEAARGGLSAARGGTAASHEVTWRRRRPDRVFLDCGLVLPGCVRACQGWEAPGETLCRHYCLWPWRRRPRASFSRRGCHVGAPFLVHGGSLGENPIQFLDGRWRRPWRRALLEGIDS